MGIRLSELAGKEMINISDGVRLGAVGDSDLIIDPETGEIESIVLPRRTNFLSFWLEPKELIVPWKTVKKIGSEVIIVELDQSYSHFKSFS